MEARSRRDLAISSSRAGESVCGFVNWGREPAGVQWVGEGEGVRETDRAVLSCA